jgi:hypothetical protein
MMIDMEEVIALQQAGDFEELTRRGIQMSGGALGLKEGWGKAPFHGMRAHYFVEVASDAIGKHGRHRFWRAVCGAEAVTHDKASMLAMGNWERCKVCLKKRNVTRSRDATHNTHNENVSQQDRR